MSDFKTFWRKNFQKNYPDFPPLTERLVSYFRDTRWLRFHSLHESNPLKSRRDMGEAEIEAEVKLYLERANAIANRVLGIGSECWMVATYAPDETDIHMIYYSDEPRCREIYGLEESFRFKDPYEKDPDGGPDERIEFRANALECNWEPGNYDAALGLAEIGAENAMWISKNNTAIFAPYECGFDLILPDTRDLPPLEKEFADWLPPYW